MNEFAAYETVGHEAKSSPAAKKAAPGVGKADLGLQALNEGFLEGDQEILAEITACPAP